MEFDGLILCARQILGNYYNYLPNSLNSIGIFSRKQMKYFNRPLSWTFREEWELVPLSRIQPLIASKSLNNFPWFASGTNHAGQFVLISWSSECGLCASEGWSYVQLKGKYVREILVLTAVRTAICLRERL